MGLMCPACGGGWERGHFCVELARTFGPYVPDLKPAQVERRRDKSPSFEELDHRNPRRSWRAMIPDSQACSSCGAPVLYLRHERTGKLAPIDLEPVSHGGTVQIADDGTYHVLTKAERGERIVVKPDDAHSGGWTATLGPPLHRPHFETCPQADYWRGNR